jgi:MFS family permease
MTAEPHPSNGENPIPPIMERRWLTLLCLGRAGTSLLYMTYSACLPVLLAAWNMNAVEGGGVQATFNLSFAVSLLLTSWLADRVGAKRVMLVSTWFTAATSIAFALLARSHISGLILIAFVGLAQGGTYTPAIMLISERVVAERRGRAVGWLLASSSLGYAGSILASWLGLRIYGYEAAFAACALGPVAALFLTAAALRHTRNLIHPRAARQVGWGEILRDRRSRLLTIGYAAHTWELLGMWAWAPAFLVASLGGSGGQGQAGLWVAAFLHFCGVGASAAMGRASDRIGRKRVLVAVAAAGAACSFVFGWTLGAPIYVLLVLTGLYGFLALGDSPVLSTAMTEAAPPGYLGRLLALRSILGFGAGAISPIAFGAILDLAGHGGNAPSTGWGLAFGALGVGGAIAALCAFRLPKARSPNAAG